MIIKISQAKQIRELLGLTHVVIFGIDEKGVQHVATHGQTRKNAAEAATAGNNLKKAIGWPSIDCRAIPLQRTCANCAYYKPDHGIHTFTGWTGDGSHGHCLFEPTRIHATADGTCHHFEPNC